MNKFHVIKHVPLFLCGSFLVFSLSYGGKDEERDSPSLRASHALASHALASPLVSSGGARTAGFPAVAVAAAAGPSGMDEETFDRACREARSLWERGNSDEALRRLRNGMISRHGPSLGLMEEMRQGGFAPVVLSDGAEERISLQRPGKKEGFEDDHLRRSSKEPRSRLHASGVRGLPLLQEGDVVLFLEQKLKDFEERVKSSLQIDANPIEEERLHLEAFLEQHKGRFGGLEGLLQKRAHSQHSPKWLCHPTLLIDENDHSALAAALDLKRVDRRLSKIHDVLHKVEGAKRELVSAGNSAERAVASLETLKRFYEEFIEAFIRNKEARAQQLIPRLRIHGVFMGHGLVEREAAYRVKGSDYDVEAPRSATQGTGTHVVKKEGAFYFKHSHHARPVEPSMERALYGLYHLLFGEGEEILSPVISCVIHDIPLKKALNQGIQQRIQEAFQKEGQFDHPTFPFLCEIVHTLLGCDFQLRAQQGEAILEKLLGPVIFSTLIPLKRKGAVAAIDKILHKNEDRLMGNLRTFLETRGAKERIMEIGKWESLQTFSHDSDLRTERHLHPLLVQVNQAIEGDLLEKVIRERQGAPVQGEPLRFDAQSFHAHVIGSLLVHGTDFKGDNFMVTPAPHRKIVGIDNDLVFRPIFQREDDGNHKLLLKNILYMMPQMEDPIEERVSAGLQALNPAEVILNWLIYLERQNRAYGFFKEHADASLFEGESRPMNLPLTLKYASVQHLYRQLMNMKALLCNWRVRTLRDLFEKLEPLAALLYRHFQERYPDPIDAMGEIYGGFIEKSLEGIRTKALDVGILTEHQKTVLELLKEADEESEKVKSQPFESPASLLKTFLRTLDLQKLSSEDTFSFLRRVYEVTPDFLEQEVLNDAALEGTWEAALEKSLNEAMERFVRNDTPLHALDKFLLGKERPLRVRTDLIRCYVEKEKKIYGETPEVTLKEDVLLKGLFEGNREAKFMLTFENVFQKKEPAHDAYRMEEARVEGGETPYCRKSLYLERWAYDQLFDPGGQVKEIDAAQRGRRKVGVVISPLYGTSLYVKFLPELPGIEEEVGELSRLLFRQGTPYTKLLRIKFGTTYLEKPLLVSEGIEGKTLKEAAEQDPIELQHLNQRQISEMILLAILTHPEDGNTKNFIVHPVGNTYERGRTYDLIPIDNDRSFVPGIALEETAGKEGKIRIQVKSALFCLNEMLRPLDERAKDAILRVDAASLLRGWLGRMAAIQQSYEALYHPGQERALVQDLVLKDQVLLEVPFPKSMMLQLYTRFLRMQKILKYNPYITGIDLLTLLEEQVGKRYRKQVEQKDLGIRARFLEADGVFYQEAGGAKTERTLSRMDQTLATMAIQVHKGMFEAATREQRLPKQALEDLKESVRLEEESTVKWQEQIREALTHFGRMRSDHLQTQLKRQDFRDLGDRLEKEVLLALQGREDLRKLYLRGAQTLDAEGGIFKTFRSLPGLEVLDLRGAKNLDRDFFVFLHTLEAHLRSRGNEGLRLKRLDLSSIPSLRRMSVPKGIGRTNPIELQTLKSLVLTGCTALREVTAHFPVLTLLDIRGCLTLERLSPFGCLEHFYMDANKLSLQTVEEVLKAAPSLKELDVGSRTDLDAAVYRGASDLSFEVFLDKYGIRDPAFWGVSREMISDPRSKDLGWLFGEVLKQKGTYNAFQKKLNLTRTLKERQRRGYMLRRGLLSPEFKELQDLYLQNNSLGDAGAKALAPSLSALTALRDLCLQNNSLGDEGAKALAPSLSALTALQYLDLRWNKLGPEGRRVIAAVERPGLSLFF